MPHQCLNCGETFAEGSTDLLEGCPACEGTRFFYTDEALEAEERKELKEETEDDVETMLQELVEGDDTPDLGEEIWSREAWERWIKLKTSDGDASELEEATQADVAFEQMAAESDVESHLDDVSPPEDVEFRSADEEAHEEPPDQLASDEEVEPVQVELGDVEETAPPSQAPEPEAPTPGAHDSLQPAPDPDDDGQPSTLNINNPGEYEIDVRRLLEDSPVIVERDGSYVIHLPSVFEQEE